MTQTLDEVYEAMTELADRRENGWSNDDQFYTRLSELNALAAEMRRAEQLAREHRPDAGAFERMAARHVGDRGCNGFEPVACDYCRVMVICDLPY